MAATTSTSGWRTRPQLEARGIDTRIPYTVDENGAFTNEAPGFEGKRVIDDKGNKGDANEAVIKALIDAGNLVARGKLKHQYPHSLALEEAGDLPQHAAMVHRAWIKPSRAIPLPEEGRADRVRGRAICRKPCLVPQAPHPDPLPAAGEGASCARDPSRHRAARDFRHALGIRRKARTASAA